MAKEFTYKLNIDAETNVLTAKLKNISTLLANLGQSGQEPQISKLLTQITSKLDDFKTKASTPIHSASAFAPMEKDIAKLNTLFSTLGIEMTKIANKDGLKKLAILPADTVKHVAAASKGLDDYAAAMARAGQQNKDLTQKQKAYADAQATAAENNQKLIDLTADKGKLDEKLRDLQGELTKATEAQNSTLVASTQASITETQKQIAEYDKSIRSITRKQTELVASVKAAKEAMDKAESASKSDASKQKAVAFENLINVARQAGIAFDNLATNLDGTISRSKANITELENRLRSFIDGALNQADAEYANFTAESKAAAVATDNVTTALQRETQAFTEQNEAASEVDGLVNRIKHFTGLTGAAFMMRRALQSAISTIKELDAQMTAMAVVTDLGVSDFWKQLTEHTERANALGMAIKDVYEAETLYYQQGLKAAEVTALSTSTLKMARIAGLSAEDATNKMTAALRGFNMEINETNADRIADVYSKLAAITASDVEEISTAMTKTASIASNAGMEFETTAAFLSQIIETTRESAETAGTAMKTVIARFQELKKAPEEIGEVDGEIVDANKIETALRTVDVALRDANGQFRALDEVFLDLAAKWDTLDMNTQRYIATIAAGSRQQSRFVAMMSNYARTQELVNAANTAAGASNEQFEKTLDSLASKLAALKNAWDTFTMGLANNEFIKTAVDILTHILNAINNVTQGFDPWSSSALKIGLVAAALIAGDKALKAFTASMKLNNSVLTSFGAALKAPGKSLKQLILTVKSSPLYMTKFLQKAKDAPKQLKTWSDASATLAFRQADLQKAMQSMDPTSIANATKEVTNAESELTNVTMQLGKSLGLTADETQNMIAFNKMGIEADNAAILAKKGYTVETLTAEVATKTGTAATDQDTIAKYGNAVASNIQSTAEGISAKSKLGLWIASKLVTNQSRLEAISKGIATNMTWQETIAQWALNMSMWQFALIVLAVVAVVILLVAAFKDMQKHSPEGKLKAANVALKEATQTAQDMQDAYTELRDSFDSLQEHYDTIEDLTMGTREWRDALLEVNGEVLDLIDKYPMLAAYVSSIDGVLTISEKGMQAALDAQAILVAQTQAYQVQMQTARTQAQLNANYYNLSSDAIAGNVKGQATLNGINGALLGQSGAFGASLAPKDLSAGWGNALGNYLAMAIGGPLGGAIAGAINGENIAYKQNREETEALARALASGNATAEQLEKIADMSGEAAKELRKYGEALLAADAASTQALQNIINSALTLIDTAKYTNTELKEMQNIGTDVMDETLTAMKQSGYIAEAKRAGKLAGRLMIPVVGPALGIYDITQWSQQKMDADELAYWEGIYGVGNVRKNVRGNLKVTDANGNTKTINSEQAIQQYATAKATEEVTKKMEALNTVLRRTGTAIQALSAAYQDDQGMALTRSDIEHLTKSTLKELWEDNEELWQIYGEGEEGYKKFVDAMTERRKLAKQAFRDNADDLRTMGLGDFHFVDNLTAGAEKGLVSHLAQIVAVSGTEVAAQYGETLNNLLTSVTAKEREFLIAQLNAIDWHNADALEDLPKIFHELEINIPNDVLKDFIDETKEVAQALHKIDFSALNEQLTDLNRILLDIATNTQGRIFEEDDYERLIKLAPELASNFTKNLEGKYIFQGGSLSDIKKATQYTEEYITEGLNTIQGQINAASILDQIIGEGTSHFTKSSVLGWFGEALGIQAQGSLKAFSRSDKWSESEQRSFIQEFLDVAQASHLSIQGVSSYLDAEGTKTDISTLTDDAIATIIEDLKRYFGQSQTLKEQFPEAIMAAVTSSLKDNPYFNSYTNDLMQSMETRYTDATDLEIAQYRTRRASTIGQAIDIGIAETDSRAVLQLNQQLIELENTGQTSTEQYREYAKVMNEFMRTLGGKSSFQTMYQGMQENINATVELLETYQKTTDEQEKMYLVSQMMREFDIQATAENYEKIAGYTEAYLSGEEQGFKNIANMAGVAAGIIYEGEEQLYDFMNYKLFDSMDETMQKFATAMLDARYAYINAEGEFIWGWNVLNDLAEDAYDRAKAWENPYDWLWNANQRVNATLRERNDLERAYQLMLEENGSTVNEIAKNLSDQVTLLQQQASYEKGIYDSAKDELTRMLSADELSKTGLPPEIYSLIQGNIAIGSYGQVTINKDALYAAGYTSEVGDVISSIIDKVDSLSDTMTSAYETNQEIEDRLREIQKTGKEQYNSLIDRVTEALRQQYQRQIDTLNQVHDAITDAANNLVDKLQEKIDDDRAAREDAKKIESLQDKQAAIAYLQASGGSALEIIQAQKALEDEAEAYQDSLVDKSIQEMSRANEQAADQRQEQIDIAQAQFDWWSENDAIHDAEAAVNASLEEIAGGLAPNQTGIATLLAEEEKVKTKTQEGITDWYNSLTADSNLAAIHTGLVGETNSVNATINTLSGKLSEALTNPEKGIVALNEKMKEDLNSLQVNTGKALTEDNHFKITNTEFHGKVDALVNALNAIAQKYVGTDFTEGQKVGEDRGEGTTNGGINKIEPQISIAEAQDKGIYLEEGGLISAGETSQDLYVKQSTLEKQLYVGDDDYYYEAAKNIFYKYTDMIWDPIRGLYRIPADTAQWSIPRFATGGLAGFTGPAWLDGTASAPELVLNATDTANLITLKDILAEIMRGTSDRSNSDIGNNYYNIDVHVESIDSDYDVDQAAERIKELIEADAMYRNVTAVPQTR